MRNLNQSQTQTQTCVCELSSRDLLHHSNIFRLCLVVCFFINTHQLRLISENAEPLWNLLRDSDRHIAPSVGGLSKTRLLHRKFPNFLIQKDCKSRLILAVDCWILQVEFLICLVLTILGYVPGIIYALYAIVFVDRDEYFDECRRPLYAPA